MLRFVAVCLMIEGHVFTTLLDRATKGQGWYPHHAFVHGYTAPMFLFGAGLAFGYSTFPKWQVHVSGGPTVRRRFVRYGWLLLLGYGLHLPALSLSTVLGFEDPARWARMLQVDVLQHIGVSLALCQLLIPMLRKRLLFTLAVVCAGLGAVFLAPYIWALNVSALPLWLAGYVNASKGSTFPLAPWCGFTYLGVGVAYVVGKLANARSSAEGPAAWVSGRVLVPFCILAALCLGLPVLADRIGWQPYPPHNFWKVNPLFFFFRLGNVVMLLSALCALEVVALRFGFRRSAAGEGLLAKCIPWVQLVGAESLVIYVGHLVLLHGSVLNPGIKHWVGDHQHGVLVALAVTLALSLVMAGLAFGWARFRRRKALFQTLQLSATLLAIGLFLLR